MSYQVVNPLGKTPLPVTYYTVRCGPYPCVCRQFVQHGKKNGNCGYVQTQYGQEYICTMPTKDCRNYSMLCHTGPCAHTH